MFTDFAKLGKEWALSHPREFLKSISFCIFDFSPKFKQIYQVYQGILEATREKDESALHNLIYSYHPTRSAMDTAVSTLKRNIHYVKNACYFSYSNGPIEEINRKIKELKRH